MLLLCAICHIHIFLYVKYHVLGIAQAESNVLLCRRKQRFFWQQSLIKPRLCLLKIN